jgi:protein-tyrosine phosphatase
MNRDDLHPAASVLFVCLGNICRSPLAEVALRDVAAREGLNILVDSAGTGDWHIGHSPDPRAQEVARRLGGIDISDLKARQVSEADFGRFDYIIAMDHNNLADLQTMQPAGSKAELSLLLDHLPGFEGGSVADPYYGDAEGFDVCWRQIKEAVEGFSGI